MKLTKERMIEMKVDTKEVVKFNMMYSPIYDGHHTDMHDIVLKHYCLYYVYKHVYTYINKDSLYTCLGVERYISKDINAHIIIVAMYPPT